MRFRRVCNGKTNAFGRSENSIKITSFFFRQFFCRKNLYNSENNSTETNNNDDPDPQLFSDEDNFNNSSESNDQEISKNEDEEDFQIPAFLRNQKF